MEQFEGLVNGMLQRGIFNLDRRSRPDTHFNRASLSASAILLPQPIPILHKFGINIFASNITGVTNPNGSNSALSIDKIPLRKQDFSLTAILRSSLSPHPTYYPARRELFFRLRLPTHCLALNKVLRGFP